MRLPPTSHEQESRTDEYDRDACNRRHEAFLDGGKAEWPEFDVIAMLGIAHSAHRHNDGAGENESRADPADWTHQTPSVGGILHAHEFLKNNLSHSPFISLLGGVPWNWSVAT